MANDPGIGLLHPTLGCAELGIWDKPISTNPAVTGAIGRSGNLHFWKSILKASPEVLRVVQFGYKLPFKSFPPPCSTSLSNNKSALLDRSFVDEQLFLLESIGCISVSSTPPQIILPLSVVMSNKKRLVVDASRNLNPLLVDKHVKLSHLELANDNLTPNCFMTTSDLESGYHQVPMHPDHRKYLGIQWTRHGKTTYFVWNVLFLRIKTAVHLFTKLLRPHIAFCQSYGIPISIYIDDQRILGDTEIICHMNSNFAAISLLMAGWVIKPGKGIKLPTQYGTFLGIDHDLVNLKYYIPQNKLTSILHLASNLLDQRRVRIKTLAGFYGKISSCRLALGPVCSLLTRSGHNLISSAATASSWDGWVTLTPHVLKEIHHLSTSLSSLNGWPIHVISNVISHRTFSSDASASGIGAAEILCHSSSHNHSGSCVSSMALSRPLTEWERTTSSTFRELLAIKELVIRSAPSWSNNIILLLCDNENVSRILAKGSKVRSLQGLAMSIHLTCRSHFITLQSLWLPRSDPRIAIADHLSRFFDLQDWGLSHLSYLALLEVLPYPPTIDLFASDSNTKCRSFFSKTPSVFSSGVNAFSFDWSQFGFGLCCPPPNLIASSIRHIIFTQATGVLIAPLWPAASFWLLLCPDGIHFSSLFTHIYIGHPTLRSGLQVTSSFLSGHTPFPFGYFIYNGFFFDPPFSVLKSSHCYLLGCNKCLS
ncbi:uncharacterized protein LOC131892025 isoform X1 [Tigriopus californicus]|uniref:uncharacterized protein LOC131892025 isoform X1 n=1 Tax=Tigriopus californicus TaxID=6832 RepID=UPI0027DA9C5B|nr:uncharacterized protein LOC131892025 isoform X1 [Tigriopus californicus]